MVENPRTIKTYVLRAGRMTDAQKKAYWELKQQWAFEFKPGEKLCPCDLFGNNNPVICEIGFGMGAATAIIAGENPGKNYLALEVHTPGVAKLLQLIKENGLENIRIIQYDALEVINSLPDKSLDGFHIFFPDPWPKKKHHKRRMITRPVTDLFCRKLRPGGYLYFVTDWEEYGYWAMEELSNTPGLTNPYAGLTAGGGFAPCQDWRPRTKFEKKGIDAGRKIIEIIFNKEDENG